MQARPRSVLLVDDDDDIRDCIAMVLEDEGIEVQTAKNGEEALQKLPHMPHPCVMILDLMMPVMTGWQVLERLNHKEHCPVLVMSAAVPPAPEGAAVCLRKPVDVDTLLRNVEHLAA